MNVNRKYTFESKNSVKFIGTKLQAANFKSHKKVVKLQNLFNKKNK